MPKITSFQGGFANDRNAGQTGSFWNGAGIDYRKNVAYIEIAKRNSDIFTTSSIPVALTLWGNGGSVTSDIVCITNQGELITKHGQQGVTPSGTAVNAFEINGVRYILGTSKLHRLQANSLAFFDADIPIGSGTTFATPQNSRPVLTFSNGDVFIGNGTSVARFEGDLVMEWYPGTTQDVIGGLQGQVVAMTQVGANVYVWCNDRTNTILYIWDGASKLPSQKIVYTDKPVKNVALLGNQHYWWSKKGDYGKRTVNIGVSYQPQEYISTEYPDYPFNQKKGSDNNRMAIYDGDFILNTKNNAIETLNNKVYLPGMGCIYSFGQSQPGGSYSLGKEIIFAGSEVVAMVSGGFTNTGRDFGGMIAFAYRETTSGYAVAIYNDGQKGEEYSSAYSIISQKFTVNMTKGSNTFAYQSGGLYIDQMIWGSGIPNFTVITNFASNVMTMDVPYEGETGPVEIVFGTVGVYESMEWLASDMYKGENDKKITVPCYIPHSSCSIRVSERRDQGVYKTIRTITSTDGTGFMVVEIPSQGKWRTKQLKFELMTTNADYSPRLYIGVDNQIEQVGPIK